jgi:hypothetical protein
MPTEGVDFGPAITDAKDTALGLVQDNVLYLLALPTAWVGFKVVKKIIAKFS